MKTYRVFVFYPSQWFRVRLRIILLLLAVGVQIFKEYPLRFITFSEISLAILTNDWPSVEFL